MGGCCPQGSWEQLKVDYKAKGEDIVYEGVPIYTSGSGDKVIVIFSDIFGAKSGRHRNIADHFASLGFNVFLPELAITPYDGVIDLPAIMKCISAQSLDQMKEKFGKVLKFLQSKGHKHFFSLAFCWGVWLAFKMAAIHNNFISIMGLHPSMNSQQLFGGKQIDLVNQVKCPAYFCPAGNDPENVKKGGELVQALEKKFGSEKTGATEFPEMMHGWTTRGDMAVQNVSRDVQKALQLAQEYFAKF